MNFAKRVGEKCSGLFEANGEMTWFTGKIIADKEKESHYNRFKVKWDSDEQVSDHSSWELSASLDLGQIIFY